MARAFNNAGFAGLDYFTPNINPFKDPRWGRGQETPCGDPLHIARYMYQLIGGLQGGYNNQSQPDQNQKYLKVAADCKHWAAYDMENWEGTSRTDFDALVETRDMVEYYALSFQSCVRDAGVSSVMCSFNVGYSLPPLPVIPC